MVARVRATTATLALAGATGPLAPGPPPDSGQPTRPGSADASAHLSSTLLTGQTLEDVGGTVSAHYQEPEHKHDGGGGGSHTDGSAR